MIKKIFNIFKQDKNIETTDSDTSILALLLKFKDNLDLLTAEDCDLFINKLNISLYSDSAQITLLIKVYFSIIKKICDTPQVPEFKIDALLSSFNIVLKSKIKSFNKYTIKEIDSFINKDDIDEYYKIYILNSLKNYKVYKLTNINNILNFKSLDLLHFIISNKLYKENQEISFNSFILFNESIQNMNYGSLQVKKKKINEILKFIFKHYEGNQSKQQLNVLLKNKVFTNSYRYKSKVNNFSIDKNQKKNFLIPLHLLEVFDRCSNINEVITNFFGTYNKRLDRLITKAFFINGMINYDIFAWGILIQPLKVNIDILCNHLEQNLVPNRLYQEEYIKYETHIFQEYYNDKRILKLIAQMNKNEIHFMKDSIEMIKIINKYNDKVQESSQKIKKLIKKPKSFKEIHDYLSILTTQIKQKNFDLIGQEKIINLEKYSNKNLSIKIPLKNYDLIEIGQKLSICVGGGHYANKINNKESLIMTVFKNNQLTYCVELDYNNYNIIQARGAFNNKVKPKDLDIITNIVSKLLINY